MCNYPCIPSQPSEMPLLRKIDSSTWMYFDKLLLCPRLHGGSCFSPPPWWGCHPPKSHHCYSLSSDEALTKMRLWRAAVSSACAFALASRYNVRLACVYGSSKSAGSLSFEQVLELLHDIRLWRKVLSQIRAASTLPSSLYSTSWFRASVTVTSASDSLASDSLMPTHNTTHVSH